MERVVVYSSRSGNTRALAEAAFLALPEEKSLYAVEQAPDPARFDLVVLGFWVRHGEPDPEALGYLARVGKRPLFLFATLVSAPDSACARRAMAMAAAQAPEAALLGTFCCRGQADPAALAEALTQKPLPAWLAEAPAAFGHPDAADAADLHAALRAAIACH
jgi:hypothetical protein